MEFEVVAEFGHPRPEVFAAYRDRVQELKAHLPNVRRVVTLSRAEEGDVVRLVNEWHAGGDLPAVVRPFVPAEATGWTDRAVWDAQSWACAWSTEPHAFREAVRSNGGHRFEAPAPGRTRVVTWGSIAIDPAKIPGVPRLLAASLRGPIEQYVVAHVKGNLGAFGRAVERHLAGH